MNAGNTIPAGQTFGYRLTYNCSNTSGPCLNAEVDDLLPAVVQFVSTVPASPTGDVAAINVTNKYALYNFLSTFSGTHYVTPRSVTGELNFRF